jgi:hypothetical protein
MAFRRGYLRAVGFGQAATPSITRQQSQFARTAIDMDVFQNAGQWDGLPALPIKLIEPQPTIPTFARLEQELIALSGPTPSITRQQPLHGTPFRYGSRGI